jgi:uncharacterized delta-60 repeat protein
MMIKNLIFKKPLSVLLFCFLAVFGLESCGGGGGDSESSSPSPSSIYWAKTYGSNSSENARSIQQTSDGGFIVAGDTSSFGTNTDVWIVKLDANGNITWQKTYGGSGVDSATSIQQTSDGGYIVAGDTSSFGTNTDVWIVKLNANGNITWQKTYGGSGVDSATSIQQTSDGGYIVAGDTSSFGTSTDAWILKLDANGNITWQKTYGGSGADSVNSIQQTSDGGFIVAGESKSFGAGDKDIWVLKINSSGGIQWQKTYGEAATEDSAYSIRQTSDGGFIVAGETMLTNVGDFWILKLDATGGVQWQKKYGGTLADAANAIRQTSDGGYIVTGGTSSFTNFFGDIWILKLDSAGAIQWEKTYGGNVSNSANSIRQTSDGGYIVAGVTTSFGAGTQDFWVLKLDGNGNIGSGCSLIETSSATVSNTTITPVDSSSTANNTTASVATTSVSSQDTNATTMTQCSSI